MTKIWRTCGRTVLLIVSRKIDGKIQMLPYDRGLQIQIGPVFVDFIGAA